MSNLERTNSAARQRPKKARTRSRANSKIISTWRLDRPLFLRLLLDFVEQRCPIRKHDSFIMPLCIREFQKSCPTFHNRSTKFNDLTRTAEEQIFKTLSWLKQYTYLSAVEINCLPHNTCCACQSGPLLSLVKASRIWWNHGGLFICYILFAMQCQRLETLTHLRLDRFAITTWHPSHRPPP